TRAFIMVSRFPHSLSALSLSPSLSSSSLLFSSLVCSALLFSSLLCSNADVAAAAAVDDDGFVYPLMVDDAAAASATSGTDARPPQAFRPLDALERGARYERKRRELLAAIAATEERIAAVQAQM